MISGEYLRDASPLSSYSLIIDLAEVIPASGNAFVLGSVVLVSHDPNIDVSTRENRGATWKTVRERVPSGRQEIRGRY
jgi:hypothetical protein